jgi:hypothetical protein
LSNRFYRNEMSAFRGVVTATGPRPKRRNCFKWIRRGPAAMLAPQNKKAMRAGGTVRPSAFFLNMAPIAGNSKYDSGVRGA